MSIYLIGKNSFIAKRILYELGEKFDIKCTSTNPTDTNDYYLDLSNAEIFNYNIFKKRDLILLLAAISSPDQCNINYKSSYDVNVKGTSYFINKTLNKGARVLFFSSDTVYGDSEGELNELSLCNPKGVYANMKYEVERNFIQKKDFKVFRLSYVFSKDDSFTSLLENSTKANEMIKVYHPYFRRIVYIDDLIEAIIKIDQEWDNLSNNIFNIAGPELISKLTIAELYKENVNKKLTYEVIKPPDDFYKNRPLSINMTSLYLEKLINREPISIKKAIIKEFKRI